MIGPGCQAVLELSFCFSLLSQKQWHKAGCQLIRVRRCSRRNRRPPGSTITHWSEYRLSSAHPPSVSFIFVIFGITRGVSGYHHFCQVGRPCVSNLGRRRSRQSKRLGPSIGGGSNGDVASSVRVRRRGFFRASSYVGCSSDGGGGRVSSNERGCVPSSGAWSKNASASSSVETASSAAAAASEWKEASGEDAEAAAWCGCR